MSKIWKRVQKIRGKYKAIPPPMLRVNNNIVMDRQTVVHILARNIAEISSNSSYTYEFVQYKANKDSLNVSFRERKPEEYNKAITQVELRSALQKGKKTAPGSDNIEYVMIKKIVK